MTEEPLPAPSHVRGPLAVNLMSAWRAVFSVSVVGAALGFLANLLAARALGAEGFGVWAVSYNLLSVLSLLGTAGYVMAILRFGPQFLTEGAGQMFRTLMRTAAVHTAVLSSGLVIAVAAAATAYPDLAPLGRYDCLILAALATPFAIWTTLNTTESRVYGLLQLALLPETAFRHAAIIAIAAPALLGLWSLGSDPIGYCGAVLVACVLSGLTTAGIARGYAPATVSSSPPGEIDNGWLRKTLAFYGIDLLFIARTQVDVFVVAALVTTADAGIYAIALRLGDLIFVITTTLTYVTTPRISQALAEGNREIFEEDQKSSSLILAAFSLAMGLPLVVGAEYWLGMFGPEFAGGAWPLIIVVAANVGRNFAGPYFYILAMSGHERVATRLLSMSVILQLLLLAVLTPTLGAAGAALARSIPDILMSGIGCYMVWRKLGTVIGVPGLVRSWLWSSSALSR